MNRYPTEAARRTRLMKVRWPHGPTCAKCSGGDATFLKSRSIYQCRKCRNQFSATTGTIMHRSRLDLGIWFRATELLIKEGYNSYYSYADDFRMTSKELAARLGIQYVAAHRLRNTILADIGIGGKGFLLDIIGLQPIEAPREITPNTLAHFSWVFEKANGWRF